MDVDVDLLLNFAEEAGFDGFAGLAFAAGEFPIETECAAGLALGDEEFAGAMDDGDGDGCLLHGLRCYRTRWGECIRSIDGGKTEASLSPEAAVTNNQVSALYITVTIC